MSRVSLWHGAHQEAKKVTMTGQARHGFQRQVLAGPTEHAEVEVPGLAQAAGLGLAGPGGRPGHAALRRGGRWAPGVAQGQRT